MQASSQLCTWSILHEREIINSKKMENTFNGSGQQEHCNFQFQFDPDEGSLLHNNHIPITPTPDNFLHSAITLTPEEYLDLAGSSQPLYHQADRNTNPMSSGGSANGEGCSSYTPPVNDSRMAMMPPPPPPVHPAPTLEPQPTCPENMIQTCPENMVQICPENMLGSSGGSNQSPQLNIQAVSNANMVQQLQGYTSCSEGTYTTHHVAPTLAQPMPFNPSFLIEAQRPNYLPTEHELPSWDYSYNPFGLFTSMERGESSGTQSGSKPPCFNQSDPMRVHLDSNQNILQSTCVSWQRLCDPPNENNANSLLHMGTAFFTPSMIATTAPYQYPTMELGQQHGVLPSFHQVEEDISLFNQSQQQARYDSLLQNQLMQLSQPMGSLNHQFPPMHVHQPVQNIASNHIFNIDHQQGSQCNTPFSSQVAPVQMEANGGGLSSLLNQQQAPWPYHSQNSYAYMPSLGFQPVVRSNGQPCQVQGTASIFDSQFCNPSMQAESYVLPSRTQQLPDHQHVNQVPAAPRVFNLEWYRSLMSESSMMHRPPQLNHQQLNGDPPSAKVLDPQGASSMLSAETSRPQQLVQYHQHTTPVRMTSNSFDTSYNSLLMAPSTLLRSQPLLDQHQQLNVVPVTSNPITDQPSSSSRLQEIIIRHDQQNQVHLTLPNVVRLMQQNNMPTESSVPSRSQEVELQGQAADKSTAPTGLSYGTPQPSQVSNCFRTPQILRSCPQETRSRDKGKAVMIYSHPEASSSNYNEARRGRRPRAAMAPESGETSALPRDGKRKAIDLQGRIPAAAKGKRVMRATTRQNRTRSRGQSDEPRPSSSRKMRNQLYDKKYEYIGLSGDPHLRMLKAKKKKYRKHYRNRRRS
ncbi:uncharacterized protein LOC131161863 isoform X2 [Malania oleifera]|uniref:uncharacterized protein LOC131161863 isoform X2 n=1 Tax=Malania oleifera TaxID=397392 RepID=UPI0025AE4EE7|nr:uncharacterized protein LOC131161863 isoform X2 [Malania oleifera]